MNLFIQQVFAAGEETDQGICNPLIKGLCGSDNAPAKFGNLISSLVAVFLIIGSLFTLVNLLIGGLNWITSGGDKAALDGARSRIQNALLGLVIVATSWIVFILITKFLGITPEGSSGFQIDLPSLFGQ